MQDENPIQERASVPRPIKGPRGPQRQPIPGRKPGVGYPMPALSYAGFDHGHEPYQMIDSEVRHQRYGPHLGAGAPGFHPPDVAENLMQAFENRNAWWPVNYEEWDGIVTDRERDDAYYGQKGDNGYAQWLASKGWEKPRVVTGPAAPAQPSVPPGASLQGVESLTPPQFAAVQAMINVLVQKGGAQ